MEKVVKNIKFCTILLLFIIGFIFVFEAPFTNANPENIEIKYSDQDYITVKVSEKDEKYSLNVETKDGGALDWIGYVSQLNPEGFESVHNFYEKAENNRTVYGTEGQALGIIYAKDKSFFRYLDVISAGVDWAINKVFGSPFRDTLTVSSKGESIYLVRTYSGSWGKFTDPSEKSFVREKVYKGNERDRQAVVLNISLATFDTLGVFIPLADFFADELNVIIEAGLRKANEETTGKAMGIEGSKEATKYLFHIAVETGEASLLKAGEIIKKDAIQNFFKFISRSCKIAVKVVDIGSKISNVGQVADRIIQMITIATPLETSYVIIGNPLLALGEEEEIKREIPEIIEKGGPTALVPPSIIEKGSYKEAIIEPEKIFKIKYLDTIWQLEDGMNLKHKKLNCESVLNTDIVFETVCGAPMGCIFFEDKQLKLNNESFRREIEKHPEAGKVLITYSSTIQKNIFNLSLLTNQNDYQRCMTDFEEVLRTLEFIGGISQPPQTVHKLTAFVKDQHGKAVGGAKYWLMDEKGNIYGRSIRSITSQTGYLEINTASIPEGNYTLHIEKVDWHPLTEIPYCDPYKKEISITKEGIDLGTITVHKWSKITAKVVDESGNPIGGGPCSTFEVIDKEGHSPNNYPTYPSHWKYLNEYGFLESRPIPDGEYTLRVKIKWDCPLGSYTIVERKVNISGSDVSLGKITIPQ